LRTGRSLKEKEDWKFRDLSEQLSLQAMSTTASVALEFLRVQNASEANGTVVNGCTSLEFCPGKQLAKPRSVMQDLSRIRPQMMQKVLSSIGLSEDKKAESFNGQSEASSHTELMELFPVSTGFGSNPRVAETNITLPFATGQTDPDSRSVPAKAPEQSSTAQLTIFYNGAVHVYDVPAEKAQAIMSFASSNSSINTGTSPTTSSQIEQISKPFPSKPPSKPQSNAVNEKQTHRPPIGLEIVRKLSLQRFLEKRKERINNVAPYSSMKTETLPSKVEKDTADQIFLSLAGPTQHF